MVEWTYSGRFAPKRRGTGGEGLAPVLVLILGTDKLLPLCDLSEREGIDVASMEWR